jgi:type IV secretory pathway component VirB8
MVNITARSTKAEIVDAAQEFTDWQAERIHRLEQQQQILFAALAALTAWALL